MTAGRAFNFNHHLEIDQEGEQGSIDTSDTPEEIFRLAQEASDDLLPTRSKEYKWKNFLEIQETENQEERTSEQLQWNYTDGLLFWTIENYEVFDVME